MPYDYGASGLEGQTLGKKFLVRRLIGEGGMGAVYEAQHVVTKRRGALKLLHKSFVSSSDIAERFLLEASAAGRIGNPHIVETIDAGELPSGEPYIFMELLSGQPLRELLLANGRIPFEEAREIVLQVADGLAAAHAAGIVHRDIKPDNLFLCAGARPFVKILDFGISKFTEPYNVKRLTEQGATLGTPHYMSPEQVVSKPDIDSRVDVYALGVVLYECLSGSVPFDAETLPALSVKIFEGQYTRVSELVSGAPAGLDAVLERALAREPSRRFSSVLQLSDALDDLAVPSADLATVVGRKQEGGQTSRDASDLGARTQLIQPRAPGDRQGSHAALSASHPPGQAAVAVTPNHRRGDNAGQRMLVLGGLVIFGLAAGAAAVLRGATTNLDPAQPGPSSSGIVARSGDSAPEPLPEARPTATGLADNPKPSTAPVTSSLAISSPAKRELPSKAIPSSSAAPRSRAATDGLSERNPFAN